jgi:hypothetical protein
MGSTRNDWRHLIWRVVTHPAFEATAVIALVVLATWAVVEAELGKRSPDLPVLFGHK